MLYRCGFAYHLLSEHFLLQIGVFGDDLRALRRVLDGNQYTVEVQRLLDEIESAFLYTFYGRFNVAVAGNHDDGRVNAVLAELFQHFRTLHVGHLDVAENHIVASCQGGLHPG